MIDHTGPMTRSVEDAALTLGVLAGYDGIDPRMTPEAPMPPQVPDYLGDLQAWVATKQAQNEWTTSSAAKGLRIGILKEAFEVPGLDPAIAATVKQAADRFRTLGADVKEISIPFHKYGAAIWTIATRPMMPHFLSNYAPDLLSHPLPDLDPLPFDQAYFDTLANRNPAVVNVLMNAAHLQRKYGPCLVRKAHMHVWELRAAYDKAFEEVDVLLTPINPTVAPKLPASTVKTESNPKGLTKRIMDLFEPIIGNSVNTCCFNVTGHPAMSMPVGWGKAKDSDAKLPVGMQIIAKRFDEASIFKAAKAWEVGKAEFKV
jgi:amidase